MKSLLDGYVCVVTGAASGIGEATVQRFLAEGAVVYAGDVNMKNPDDEGRLHRRPLDVTSSSEWQTFIDDVIEREGRIDVLFNNAGLVGSYESITEIAIDEWHRVVNVNQTSVFLGMRAVIPQMQKRKRGSIINMSSLWGLVGTSGVSAYQASKGAVMLMTKNAAITYASQGIRVNSVHPGLIMTPMTRSQDVEITRQLIEATPMKRAGEASEVAAVVTFLASEEASYITGAQILIDGGLATQ